MSLYIIAGILILVIFYPVLLYNSIIRQKNEVMNAFGSVDATIKKRYDLIPNLVETVKRYMTHEATVLSHVTELRSKYSDQMTDSEKVRLHNDLNSKINGIMVAVENYPDLKASSNFLKLQAAWNEAEDQITASRRYYNAAVTDYNNAIQTFPASIIAGIFSFKPKNVFEIGQEERENVSAKALFE